MERIRKINFIVIAFAAIASFVIGIQTMSSPVTLQSVGILIWLVSPYICLAVMAKVVSGKSSNIVVLILSLLSAVFGIWALIDAMFIQNDAQGSLAFVVVPAYQWALLLVTSLPLYFLNRKKNEP